RIPDGLRRVGRTRPPAGARVGRRHRPDDPVLPWPAARPRHGRLRAHRSVSAGVHRRAPDYVYSYVRSVGDLGTGDMGTVDMGTGDTGTGHTGTGDMWTGD